MRRTVEIPYQKIKQSIDLSNGERVVVYWIESANQEMPRLELLRNVFKLTRDGSPAWRIQVPPSTQTGAFIEVYLSADGRLLAYNVDSWEYEVDIESGMARPDSFLK